MDKNRELSSFAAFFSFSYLGQGSLLVEVFSFVSCVSPLLLGSPEIYRTMYYQFTQVAQKMHRGRCCSASKNLWVNIQKYAEVCGEYCAVIIDMWRYRDKEEDWCGGSPSYSWVWIAWRCYLSWWGKDLWQVEIWSQPWLGDLALKWLLWSGCSSPWPSQQQDKYVNFCLLC